MFEAPPPDQSADPIADPRPHTPSADRAGGFVLDAADHELIAAARETLVRHYRPFWHTVAAAMRGIDGRIWTGVHLGATVGRLAICAEAIALGRAIMDGDGTIATAVALRHPKPEEDDREIAVVSPCGACREMIVDYAPEAHVIVPDGVGHGRVVPGGAGPGAAGSGIIKLPIRVLLPLPYRR